MPFLHKSNLCLHFFTKTRDLKTDLDPQNMQETRRKENIFFCGLNIFSGLQMELRSHIGRIFPKLSEIKKAWVHLLLSSSILVPIFLILILDFLNIEASASFNSVFMFDLTWKGRMFYLFFAWLFVLESFLDWEIVGKKQLTLQNRFRVILAFGFAIVPTVFVLGVNFLGMNQMVLDLSEALHVRSEFVGDWTLSIEYLVLSLFFLVATWLAYGRTGLKSFSISLSLLAGMGLMYSVDTVWPYGTFKPMQLLAVPTAAFATGLLDLLGYQAALTYPVKSPEYGSLPIMTVSAGGETVRASVAWPCAGVHSLLLFSLITLVFFKRTTMQRDRKMLFFLLGAAGTYITNILRIASYFAISIHHGSEAGLLFHNSYGELYFIAWIFIYLLVVTTIQSERIGRFAQAFREKMRIPGIQNRRSAQ